MSTKRAYKSHRNVSYSCKYHVVWCPKYQRKVLINAVAEHLAPIMHEVCQQHQAEGLSLEIMPDHVHVLGEVEPHFGIHRFVRLIKGRSSRLLRQAFPSLTTRMPTLWTKSSCVRTVGGAPWAAMKQYIENQKYV